MPGPQFLAPQPVSRTQSRRRFTLKQANSSLPLVQRIVSDIVRTHGTAGQLQTKLSDGGNAKTQQATQSELDVQLARLQEYIDELTSIGCDLKDCQMGLVDFVGRHRRRDVYLCWKLGEESIKYFHEMDSGYAGRQSISLLDEGE